MTTVIIIGSVVLVLGVLAFMATGRKSGVTPWTRTMVDLDLVERGRRMDLNRLARRR